MIGAGSSAIQIIPAIQGRVKGLFNFMRGEVWIAPPFAGTEVEKHQAEVNCKLCIDIWTKFAKSNRGIFVQSPSVMKKSMHFKTRSSFMSTERVSQPVQGIIGILNDRLAAIETELQSFHQVTHQGEASKVAQGHFQKNMEKKLRSRPEILEKILPSFPPGCRRLTPVRPDYPKRFLIRLT